MPDRVEASKTAIRELFERGALYADRWGSDMRAALDVPDDLTAVVAQALEQQRSVVLAGNAGDGKSHLAQCALDRLATRRCLEITKSDPMPALVPSDSLVFIRDASSLSDDEVLGAVYTAIEAGAPVLLTVNEGPLSSLAQADTGTFFKGVRDALHARAMGDQVPDDPTCLIVNLAGRQLTRSNFVKGVLDNILPVVVASPCKTCGKATTCPRVVGAKMLKKSKRAQGRLQDLLKLLTDGGRHLSAREIWVFLIDLFFGWTCPAGGEDVDKLEGFFWMRIFEGSTAISGEVALEFDPITVPMAREDVFIWQGQFDKIESDAEYPGTRPSTLARDSEDDGLRAFASAKRCYFFFARKLDVHSILMRRSLAPKFGKLLESAMADPRPVIRDLVGMINSYRLNRDTENDLWISRHHGMAAHRRPAGIGAAGKVPIEQLVIRVPYSYEAGLYTSSGFFPDKLYLCWTDSLQYLPIDFETWQRMQADRTLTVDRGQETLDFALDLFLSQANVAATDDPEIDVFDHRNRELTRLRIRPEERKIEVIS